MKKSHSNKSGLHTVSEFRKMRRRAKLASVRMTTLERIRMAYHILTYKPVIAVTGDKNLRNLIAIVGADVDTMVKMSLLADQLNEEFFRDFYHVAEMDADELSELVGGYVQSTAMKKRLKDLIKRVGG